MNMNGLFSQGSPPSHLNPAALYNNPNPNNQFDTTTFSPQNAAFPNHNQQSFQPSSVVPAKRPHDNMSAGSPQISRSQTPSFFGNQQQQFPTPYAHLQQPGSNNASPSPIMSNQQFRPPGQPPRMQPNASPSPFPGQAQQTGFGNQMSPATPQQTPQPTGTPQPGQMGGWNQNMNMSTAMPPQMNNDQVMAQAQRNYQAQLLQQQRQMQQSGMMGPRAQSNTMSNFNGQQQPAQMTNGQAGQPTAMNAQQQQQQQHLLKRNGFLKQLMAYFQSLRQPFNPNPTIGGRAADLYLLWSFVTQLGGSSVVDKNQQWQALAQKMNFPQAQFPGAAEEMRAIFAQNLSGYERIWLSKRAQAKQHQQAHMNAHQMAGLGPTQPSPTRTMQPPTQQNQFQPGAAPAQATPVQANAQLAQHNMTTPQQMMHHRRSSSSIRKPDQMTPQAVGHAPTGPSTLSNQKMQSPVSVKQPPAAAVMKSEEIQSTNYVPHMRSIEMDGGYDMNVLYDLGTTISKTMPNMPSVDEMGVIDTKAIMLSLASGLHAEVRYALDMLAIISNDTRIHFDLEKCEDLLDVIVDCAEEQIELLSDDAVEVSDAMDLPSYEDMMRGSRAEVDELQEVAAFGTTAYELDRAADKVIAITTVLRNFSFYEFNHGLLTSTPLIKWLCNTIRLLGTRNMLLRTHYNTQDFYKDMITFLSNVTQSLELPSRDDALHILHFLLAFAPQPAPSYTEGGDALRFTSFVPTVHRYLPPAVDCLAKLLARQDPNRMLYKSIFTASGASAATSELPLDLLTRAFALSISILPDRSKGGLGSSHQLRIVEARKAYLSQGMLAADILTSLAPNNDNELARAWIESEDGWAVGLLNLAALLSVDRSATQGPKGPIGHDTETFKLISHRALAMMKRLAERAGKSSQIYHSTSNGTVDDMPADILDGHVKKRELQLSGWEGIPQSHAILGALMLPQSDCTSLSLLCNLYELASQDGRGV